MYRLAALAVVLGCSQPQTRIVLGEPPSEDAADALHVSAMPNVRFAIAGTSDDELAAAALAYVRDNLAPLAADDFAFAGAAVDPELISIQLAQRYHGLPVIGGHLGLVISRGNLVLVQGNPTPIRGISTSPAILESQALEMVKAGLAPSAPGDRDDARLVIYRGQLAWEVSAWRRGEEAIVYVDAADANLLYAYDATRYDYAGTATNNVDARTVGDPVVALPASHLRLRTARGSTAVTDDEGAFAFRGDGKLFVSASLQGRYVNVQNLSGENATFFGVMRPETNYALEWTQSHSSPEERDVFRGTSETNRFVSTVFPNLPWLAEPLLAKVNHNRTCNAFWNGSSINFFVAGNGCNNSGRIFDVIAHEWGHGLDQNAPGGAIDGALGEFIGDLVSFVQTRSPLLGPNFFTNGRAVRDLDDPAFQCFNPKVRQVHAAGQLLGALVYDIFEDLQRAGVTGERLKRLMLRPIAIAQTRAEWYAAMLAVDDDDGNLANGTPHECLIYKQYKAHSCAGTRWPGMPAQAPPGCE